MTLIEKVQQKVEEHLGMRRLVYIILFLSVFYLITLTWGIWSTILLKLRMILLPFIIGFGMAFVLRPMIVFFEKRKIKRSISVPVFLIVFIGIFSWLFATMLPSVYDDLSSLFDMAVEGIETIYNVYIKNLTNSPSPMVEGIFNNIVSSLSSIVESLPTMPNLVTGLVSTALSWLTTGLFSFIIGMYFIADYERFTAKSIEYASRISPKLSTSIVVSSRAISEYLRTLVVVMGITFVEYSVFYFLIGHRYAFIMGVFSAFALIIPYVGGIAANTIGFLTGLSLSGPRLIFLALGVLILPNVDSYLISPLVYSKRDKINPLWSLFSFFAASTMFGFVGILLSMPLYFSIRSIIKLKSNNWVIELDK